ncbi:MAG: hypothetical protein K6T30_05285 [Alicyclobacillus sp.]|nr:hypothetical protein [Alicyclobacillus sp.]
MSKWDSETPGLLLVPALVGEEPWLYLWPHRQGTDGFFLCRLERGEG